MRGEYLCDGGRGEVDCLYHEVGNTKRVGLHLRKGDEKLGFNRAHVSLVSCLVRWLSG